MLLLLLSLKLFEYRCSLPRFFKLPGWVLLFENGTKRLPDVNGAARCLGAVYLAPGVATEYPRSACPYTYRTTWGYSYNGGQHPLAYEVLAVRVFRKPQWAPYCRYPSLIEEQDHLRILKGAFLTSVSDLRLSWSLSRALTLELLYCKSDANISAEVLAYVNRELKRLKNKFHCDI